MMRHLILLLGFMATDASIITRYIFIFWLKNPVAFNDDFWYQFTWLWIQGAAILNTVTIFFLDSYRPVTFYICSGKDPTQILNNNHIENISVIPLATIVFHILIYTRIYFYKRKNNPKEKFMKDLALKDVETQAMANYYVTQAMVIFILCSTSVAVSKLNGINPKDLGKHPNNMLIYYRSLFAPVLAILLLSISFMIKKNYVKAFVDEFRYLFLRAK